MSFEAILGQARPLRVLRRALSSGRMPHAYLFWGPEGVGKESVARCAAGVLLCADPGSLAGATACGRCPSCRKVAAGDHPDLHVVAAKGTSISINDVRALQESLSFQSFERGRKVAIIRDAFRMTREASNALLKTVEEPSAGTHVFLLAHHRNQLLPTLVSRCQALRFDPLAEPAVKEILEARGVPAGIAAKMAELSGGCPGVALEQDPEAFVALDREVEEVWAHLPAMDAAERFALSDRWARDRENLGLRLDRLEWKLRARAREAARRGAAEEEALDGLEGVLRARRLREQNVNLQLVLDALFLRAFEGTGDEIL